MLPFHPLGVHVGVRDLQGTCTFLEEVVGLPVKARAEHWAELDNASTVLRLVKADSNTPLSLVLLANDIDKAVEALTEHEGVELVAAETWATPERKEARLRYHDWLELVIARNYNEDELGIQPDLPMELEWDAEARELLLALLAKVPVVFRESARTKSTRRAEELSVEEGEVTVGKYRAVRGLVHATPVFQHKSLWLALTDLNEDPTQWEPDLIREVKLK